MPDSKLVPNFRPIPLECLSWMGDDFGGGVFLSHVGMLETYSIPYLYGTPYTATFCPYGIGVNTLWYHEDGLHRQYQQSLFFPCLFVCLSFFAFCDHTKSQFKVYRKNRHKLLRRDCWHLFQHSFVILEEIQVQVFICFYTSTTEISHICRDTESERSSALSHAWPLRHSWRRMHHIGVNNSADCEHSSWIRVGMWCSLAL